MYDVTEMETPSVTGKDTADFAVTVFSTLSCFLFNRKH